jgi:hypothetical protein
MKLATRKSDGKSGRRSRVTRRVSAFTLAEVMAAMLFLAVVVPVAVEVLHISTLAGEVAVRKGVAARIADRILNENLVATDPGIGTQSGQVTENGLKFDWTLTRQSWTEDSAMDQVTSEVKFTAQGKEYSVKLDTLVQSQAANTLNLLQ